MKRLRMLMAVGPVLALVGALGLAAPADATTLTLNFTDIAIPDDDSGVLADVTVIFDWDEGCSVDCTLRIDLVYNDVNGASGLPTPALALSGVTWDTTSSITVDEAASRLIAPTLVGSQSGTASSELPDLTLDGVSGDDVTGHWSFRDDLANAFDGNVPSAFDDLGDYVLSSVGDLTFGGTMAGVTGSVHVLTSGACSAPLPGDPQCTSSVEPSPPDGIPFAVVDPDTSSLMGTAGDVALANNTTVAFLEYDGTLSGIENVRPHFGTDGVVAPEPGATLLVATAFAGLVAGGRRRARG